MTSRERVSSPDELRGGDRVEVVGARGVVVIDLLARDKQWFGLVIAAPAGFPMSDGSPVTVGRLVAIRAEAYPLGSVFVRRRSREDRPVARKRVIRTGSFDALQRLLDAEAGT